MVCLLEYSKSGLKSNQIEIQIHAWRDRELIVITVPHTAGPYYINVEGPEKGGYIRLGSTNRRAGPEMIAELQRLARNIFFDEQLCAEVSSEGIDFRAASEFFSAVSRQLTSPRDPKKTDVLKRTT